MNHYLRAHRTEERVKRLNRLLLLAVISWLATGTTALLCFAPWRVNAREVTMPQSLRVWPPTDAPTQFVLGPEALVSSNQSGGDLRCEPSAAIFKSRVVVAWNDSYGGLHGASPVGTNIGWAISEDRGKTFRFGGYLPLAQGDPATPAADSRLAVDGEGNFFLEALSWQGQFTKLQLYVMPNNAAEWRKLPDPVVYEKSKGEEYVDKPAMSVTGNRIAIVYTEKRQTAGPTISAVFSYDRGQTWSIPAQLSGATNRVRSSSAITINKNEVVATWTEGDSSNATEIWFSRSIDGGKSFSVGALAYQLRRPFTPPRAYRMGPGQMADISNDTSLASVNNSPGDTTYYLSCVEGTEIGSDVVLMAYDAKSQKWSAPVRVPADSKGTVKIFSSMALIGGRPALLYYQRNDVSDAITDVYLSILTERNHFESMKLNTESSDWAATKGDMKYAPIQRIFGDYISLASDGRSLAAAWTDGRQGMPRIYARIVGVD